MAANRNVKFYLQPQDNWVADELDVFKLLSGAGEIIIDDSYEASTGTPTFLTPIGKMFMPLEGLVDIEAEKIRINKEIDKTDKDLKQFLESFQILILLSVHLQKLCRKILIVKTL